MTMSSAFEIRYLYLLKVYCGGRRGEWGYDVREGLRFEKELDVREDFKPG
jgi:hypothetical protein